MCYLSNKADFFLQGITLFASQFFAVNTINMEHSPTDLRNLKVIVKALCTTTVTPIFRQGNQGDITNCYPVAVIGF